MDIKAQLEIQRMYRDGSFSKPDDITRESIDTMKKADVRDLLEMHGAPTDGPVAEMRERLKSVMFVEIA